jgi:hypothetical protein
MKATEFYYSDNGTPDVWTKINIPSFRYTDSVGLRSRLIQATIPDARNIYVDDFFAYQRIKLVEKQTGDNNLVFLGRVEDVAPQLNDSFGQVVVVSCRDYVQELIERKVNSNYSTAEKRSAKINRVITDYAYAGAGFARTIEASGSDGTLTRNLTSSKVSPLEFIEELAQEDPWTNSTWDNPAGAVWKWNGAATWANDTVEADSVAGTPFALMGGTTHRRYFGRNNPFAGLTFNLAVNGSYGTITWEYWNGVAWTAFIPTALYAFTGNGSMLFDPPADWTARTFTAGDPHAGAPPDGTSRYWIRMRVSAITVDATVNQVTIVQGNGYDYRVDDEPRFFYFRRGSRPAGGPATNGLTIQFGASASAKVLPMLSDYEFSNTPKEIVTRVTVRGNDASGNSVTATETDSPLETQLKIVKERIEYVYGATTSAEVTQRAKSLLRERGNSVITHGKVAVLGLPFYYIGSTCTLLRAGDLVRIKCSPQAIDDDFLVLEMTYEEPACVTTLTLLSHAWGRGWVSGDDMDSTITEIRKGLSIPMASIGDLIVGTAVIADLSVTDAKILNLSVSKLTTGSLTVAATLGSGGALQTGAGTSRVEIVPTGIKAYDAGTQRVAINSDGSGWLGASSGAISWTNTGVLTLAAATVTGLLTAATISVTNLTAGNLTVAATMGGSGAMKSGAATARVEMTTSGIKAYDSGGTQRVQISNDGSGWFGTSTAFAWTAAGALTITAGASGVKISSSGVNIWGDGMLTTRPTEAGTIQCKVDSTGAISAGGGAVVLNATGIKITSSYGSGACSFVYGSYTGYLYLSASGNLVLSCTGKFINVQNYLDISSAEFGIYNDSAAYCMFSTWNDARTSAYVDHIYCPVTANYGMMGHPSYYWYKMYSAYYYYKYAPTSFQTHDDISLVKSIKTKKEKDRDGKVMEVFDIASFPKECIVEEDEIELVNKVEVMDVVDGEVNGKKIMKSVEKTMREERKTGKKVQFFDMQAVNGLMIGTVKQMAERIETLEASLAKLQKTIK